jgi:hypothetical protein
MICFFSPVSLLGWQVVFEKFQKENEKELNKRQSRLSDMHAYEKSVLRR